MSWNTDIIIICDENEKDLIQIANVEEVFESVQRMADRYVDEVRFLIPDFELLSKIMKEYCDISIINDALTICFQEEHYSQVIAPLWNDFYTGLKNFSFLDFMSPEGKKKLRFSSTYSPIIIYQSPYFGMESYTLEDFFRSDIFEVGRNYTVLGICDRRN